MKRTLVIIVNYNGKKELEYSFPSVCQTKGGGYKVLLSDNGSKDDSVEYVKNCFPEMEIIKNNKNLAWAEGNNVPIRYGLQKSFDYFALLNNDILVPDFWLSQSTTLFENIADCGIIGFHIIGFTRYEPIEKYQSAVKAWKELVFSPTESVSGCCMLIRKEVFDAIGLIDKEYYKYGEEVDFVCRARKAGFKVLITNIPVWHAFGATSAKMPYSTAYYCIRNDLRFAIKQKNTGYCFKRLLKLFYVITLPFRSIDKEDLPLRRLRPSNYWVNNGILFAAILWNLIFLFKTLSIKNRENKRIRKYLKEKGIRN